MEVQFTDTCLKVNTHLSQGQHAPVSRSTCTFPQGQHTPVSRSTHTCL